MERKGTIKVGGFGHPAVRLGNGEVALLLDGGIRAFVVREHAATFEPNAALPLSIEEVEREIVEINDLVRRGDYERAHIHEDELLKYALTSLTSMSGYKTPAVMHALADATIKVYDIDYPRYSS